jgi:hypothetical protein
VGVAKDNSKKTGDPQRTVKSELGRIDVSEAEVQLLLVWCGHLIPAPPNSPEIMRKDKK